MPIELKIELWNGTWIGLDGFSIKARVHSIDSNSFGSCFCAVFGIGLPFLVHSIFIECSLCFTMFPSSSTAVNLPGLPVDVYLQSVRVRHFRINAAVFFFSIHDMRVMCLKCLIRCM